ncbi:hypothetical protein R1sor_022002 [Riccia sorocarpa]|uniref:Peptidase S9 prolyl oligopeptidase catalytic domain-containing protein n=1 Tax=Riccia sorocarpa TaxID=122646 RepID=A0ABD3GMF1_9MARC
MTVLEENGSGSPQTEGPELIPTEILFGYHREQARLSPDGKFVAYLAPSPDQVSNVWVRPLDGTEEEARMVTKENHRGIRWFLWNPSGEYIIYKQDNGGDENWRHFAVDLATGDIKDLTPYDNVSSRLVPSSISGVRPYDMSFYLNIRDKSVFDVYKINIKTAEAVLDTENPGDVQDWLCDSNSHVRGALHFHPDGSFTIRVRDSVESEWRDVLHWSSQEHGSMVGFASDPKKMYILSSLDSPTTRLVLINTEDGSTERVIASDPKCDVLGFRGDISKVLFMDFRTREYTAVAFTYDKLKWTVLDPSVKEHFDLLTTYKPGNMYIGSRDRQNQKWVVTYEVDNGTPETYIYERSSKKFSLLFQHHPALNRYKLASVQPHVIKARDGLEILFYLTLPVDLEPKNLPMVLRTHGGPWFRDWWGWDNEAQYFASRGYACLQVQYRGSDGFGKAFLHAGDKQWAANMQNDITDSVLWTIEQGIVDKDRVAIGGISFGSFCALAGAAFTPELYKCCIDLVGPSQLKTVTTKIVPYWKPRKRILHDRVIDLENDDELNQQRSPYFHADKIQVPVIIANGGNDIVVNPGESEQMFKALEALHKPVTYLVYEDEGHWLERPQNKMDWFWRLEKLLHKQIGGRLGTPPPVHKSGARIVYDAIGL